MPLNWHLSLTAAACTFLKKDCTAMGEPAWHPGPLQLYVGPNQALFFVSFLPHCAHMHLGPPAKHVISPTSVTSLHYCATVARLSSHNKWPGPPQLPVYLQLIKPLFPACPGTYSCVCVCLKPASPTTQAFAIGPCSWVCAHYWLQLPSSSTLVPSCWTWRDCWGS